jgi:hypothetical protein
MAKKFQVGGRGSMGPHAAGTVTVNHGCGAAPSAILVTSILTGSTDIYVNNITNASFDLTFTNAGNGDFYWVALVL